MPVQSLFTTPILCKCANGEWFVFFRYWNNETKSYKPFKCSEGLNRIKNLKEKEAEFKALREAREIWLKQGWNPIADRTFELRKQLFAQSELAEIKNWTVEKALKHVLQTKKMAVKSRYDYKKSVEYFLQAATNYHYHAMPIAQLEKSHIKAIFSILLNQFKLSNKNYNKRLEHIKSLLSELVEWDAIKFNPAFGIKALPEEETTKFIPLTSEERILMHEYLAIKSPGFLAFCMTIFFTGIRPDEILSLKVSDINTDKLFIKLNPFTNATKVKKERFKALHPQLLHYYHILQLHQQPANNFVFSNNFLPGNNRIKARIATALWKKLIWVELGIEKYLYSLKHAGADELIMAGIDEDMVKDHLGHTTKFMTRRYTQLGLQQSKDKIINTNINFLKAV